MLQSLMRASVLFVTAGLVAVGCSSTTGPDPADVPGYPERTSPENVIAKFEAAYEAMDAEEYLDCLSEDFVFFVNPGDTQGWQPLPESWDRAVEDTVAWRMFRESSGIDSIRVWMTPEGDPEEVPGQGPGDPSSWRYTYDATVSVHLPQDIWFYADCRAVLIVRPDADDLVRDGRQLWEIAEHHDFDESLRGSREMPSWSRIKAYFGGLYDERNARRE